MKLRDRIKKSFLLRDHYYNIRIVSPVFTHRAIDVFYGGETAYLIRYLDGQPCATYEHEINWNEDGTDWIDELDHWIWRFLAASGFDPDSESWKWSDDTIQHFRDRQSAYTEILNAE